MDEIVYLHNDNENKLQVCSINDEAATAYIRADRTDSVSISDKRDMFTEGHEHDESMISPCGICKHNKTDELQYPCAACLHIL